MHYDFELAGRRVRLWQRTGESYEHVLMKALGYAMFVPAFPDLEIERRVGLRYKPDLVAPAGDAFGARRFLFWGECGMVTMRKVAWLLKHAGIERLALFKIAAATTPFVNELRASIDERYRGAGRVSLINFVGDIVERAASRRIARVPAEWYNETAV